MPKITATSKFWTLCLSPKCIFGESPKHAPVLFADSVSPRPHTFWRSVSVFLVKVSVKLCCVFWWKKQFFSFVCWGRSKFFNSQMKCFFSCVQVSRCVEMVETFWWHGMVYCRKHFTSSCELMISKSSFIAWQKMLRTFPSWKRSKVEWIAWKRSLVLVWKTIKVTVQVKWEQSWATLPLQIDISCSTWVLSMPILLLEVWLKTKCAPWTVLKCFWMLPICEMQKKMKGRTEQLLLMDSSPWIKCRKLGRRNISGQQKIWTLLLSWRTDR